MPMVSFGECIGILQARSLRWVHITPAGRVEHMEQELEFAYDAMVEMNPRTVAIAWADEDGDPVLVTATLSGEDEDRFLQVEAWFVSPGCCEPAQFIIGTRLLGNIRSHDKAKLIGIKPGVFALLFTDRVRLYNIAKREWSCCKYPDPESSPCNERALGIIEADVSDGIALVLPPIPGQGPPGSPVHALLTVGYTGQGIVWNVDTLRAIGLFMNYKSGSVMSMAHDGGCLWKNTSDGLLKLRCVVPATYWAVLIQAGELPECMSNPPIKHAGTVRLLHEALVDEATRPPAYTRRSAVIKGTVPERMETLDFLNPGAQDLRLISTPLHPDVLVVGGMQAPRRARWQPSPPYLRMGPRMTEHARVLSLTAEVGAPDPQLVALMRSMLGDRPMVHGTLNDVADLCMQQNGVGLMVPTLGEGWLAVCRWRSPAFDEQRIPSDETQASMMLAVGRGPANPHPATELYQKWEKRYNKQFKSAVTFTPRAPPGTVPLIAQMRARWRASSVRAQPFGPVGVHWTGRDLGLKRLCSALASDQAHSTESGSSSESELEDYVPAWAQHDAPSDQCINSVDHGPAHAYVCITCMAEQQVRAELRAPRDSQPAASEAPAPASAAATSHKRKRIVPTRVTRRQSAAATIAAAAAAASDPGPQAVSQVAPELNDFVQRATKHKVLPVYLCSTCAMHCHAGHDVRNIGLRQALTCECGTEYAREVFRGDKLTGRPAPVEGHLERTRCIMRSPDLECHWMSCPRNPPSQNGVLRYCRCGQDERFDPSMLQCIGCDDWWHSKCIAPDAPGDVMLYPDGKFVCPECYERRPAADLVELAEKPLGTSARVVERLTSNGKIVHMPCPYGGIWFAESESAVKNAFVARSRWSYRAEELAWFQPDPSVMTTQVGQIYARVSSAGLP